MEKQKEEVKELLTTAETAKLMQLSVRSIYRITKTGILKRYTLGGRKYFYKRSEVLQHLKDAPIKAAA